MHWHHMIAQAGRRVELLQALLDDALIGAFGAAGHA